jgi:hypothetical protein
MPASIPDVFLKQCLSCDGPIGFDRTPVESCCRTSEVVALGCEGCDARLFESEIAA